MQTWCDMNSWIISVCGIALLTVVCDAIFPDGGTKKYVKTVVGIVMAFTMLAPITRFFENISTDNCLTTGIYTQQQYIEGISNQKQLARLQKVKNVVDQLKLPNCSVDIRNNYVCVTVCCNEQTLTALQTALAGVDDQIMIAWRKTDG